jgi:hypothetical protein
MLLFQKRIRRVSLLKHNAQADSQEEGFHRQKACRQLSAHPQITAGQAALSLSVMFLDLSDPDPLVRGTYPDPSIIEQK